MAIPENVPDKKEEKKATSKKTSAKKEQQEEVKEAEFEIVEFSEPSDNDDNVPDTVSFAESDEEKSEEAGESSDVELPDFMKKRK